MNKLINYCKGNFLNYEKIGDSVIKIAGKTFELIKPNEEGKLMADGFVLMAGRTEYDNYVFSFGGNYYWTPFNEINPPQLNPLMYLGKTVQNPTKYFLGVRGGYELLNGSNNYKNWVKKAKFMGTTHLGICEKNTLAGVMKFQNECVKNDILPIIGEIVTVERNDNFRYDLKLYCKSQQGFENLLEINKYINVDNKGFIGESDLFNLISDLVVILDPKCISYEDIFPLDLNIKQNLYYQLDTVEYEDNERDKEYLKNLQKFVRGDDLKPILITDAFYLEKDHSHIKKILNNIADNRDYVSNNQYFKSEDEFFSELDKLFNLEDESFEDIFTQSLRNLKQVSEICGMFQIETGIRHLPNYLMTNEEKNKFETNEDLFWYLIEDGLKRKVPKNKIQAYLDRVEREVDIIEKGGVVDYFLILWDIIKWSRNNDILVGYGRGSSAGCLISYLLDIVHLDPLEFDLLFERFLDEARMGTFEEHEKIIIKTEKGETEYWHNDKLSVVRNGRDIYIKACEILKTDEIKY